MCGGRGDPRGRYILIPEDGDDEWSGECLATPGRFVQWRSSYSACPYNGNLSTVIKEKIDQSKRSISRRGMSHQTFTKINKDAKKLEQLRRQVRSNRNSTKVCLHRSSSYNGFREFCAEHGCRAENPPSVYSFEENGIVHLAFCYSAHKGDILEDPALLNKLLEISPAELIFETEDRVGREYSNDTIKLLRSVGFKVTIENKKDMTVAGNILLRALFRSKTKLSMAII